MSNSLASVHPELIPEWSERNLPLTPDKITFGSNKRVWWKGACGHEWETSVKARSKGEKCPICSGARVIEGINDLATLKPLLSQEWFEKNKLKPTEVSVASHKKIIWKCKHGHEWEASVKSRTINGTGCPYCSHNKVLAGFNDLASQYPDIAAEWSDRNLPLLPTMVTAFANSKAWWKCKDCGNEWHTLISTRAGGSRCPYCSGYSDDQIVTVALSQVGNVGGQPYWSWYGFDSRVEWCACFVSWCANECGYIDAGIIPKYAGCVNGVQWFRDRGQWADGSYEPSPGTIIFFDWEGDGVTDHTGIVQKCENGTVYTVEGNSGDTCRTKTYPVGSSVIFGYGIPAY